MARVILKLHVA